MSVRLRRLPALAGLVLAACVPRGAPLVAPQVTSQPPDTRFQEGQDPLSLRMQAIAKQLATADTRPGREAFRGFLTTGTRTTHPISLPASTCATLVAIASRGVHDMDAALYSDEGDLLALDSQPDAHPTMQVCTGPEARRLYYTLQVYEGAGSYLIVPFLGPPAALDTVSKLLGTPTTVARLGQAGSDGPERVSAFREGLERRGFSPLQAPLRVSLAVDQRIRVELPTAPGACYTAAGFVLSGIDNVDLRVLDEEGTEIARDASTEQDAGVQFCTDEEARYAAELHDVAGSGEALLLLFRIDAAAIGGASGLWLGERPLHAAATAPLQEAVASASKRASQDGFKRTRSLRTGQLVQGQLIEEPLQISAKRCARIEAVSGPGLRRLALRLRPQETREARRTDVGPDESFVHVCASGARELSVELHAVAGFGPYALLVHEAPMASVVPAGADEVIGASLQQAYSDARAHGFAPHPLFEVGPRRIALSPGKVVAISAAVESAYCVRAYLVTADPAARARFRVAGKQLGAGGEGAAPAKACLDGADARALEVETSSEAGQGEAWLMVFVR